MKLAWKQGLDKETSANLEKVLKSSSLERSQLIRILRAKYEEIDRKGLREEDYADTSWVTLQAFRNGKIAMIYEILSLYADPTKDKE